MLSFVTRQTILTYIYLGVAHVSFRIYVYALYFIKFVFGVSTSTGINAGVMLMNATRMRMCKWEDHVMRVYHNYGFRNLPLADQDIINVVLAEHPCAFLLNLSDFDPFLYSTYSISLLCFVRIYEKLRNVKALIRVAH